MHFKLEKPDISKITPERMQELLSREDVREVASDTIYPYGFWTEVKYKPWPKDLSAEEKWAATKHVRTTALAPFREQTVVQTKSGEKFTLLKSLPWFDDLLHHIDLELGGTLRVTGRDLSESMRERLVARGVMEEAIASSQIEGAHTTRSAAKRMLQQGRKPKTKDELMILNNYRAMLQIEQEFKNAPLSVEILMKLHAILTEGTLEPAHVGVLRDDEGKPEPERIAVRGTTEDTIYHMPPPVSFVEKELRRLIAYANDDNSETDMGFMHPVIKAIILHFWIGYLHPFVDGNGRLARALFYWYMLKKGYWAFAFIPLSAAIKNSQTQYQNAYLYTEQDDNDLTYFVDYNLRKIQQARREFDKYVQEKWATNSRIARRVREKYSLNDRQVQLLQYFFEKGHESASLQTHMNIHGISRPTAMRDFHELETLGFVSGKKVGREMHYFGTEKIRTGLSI